MKGSLSLIEPYVAALCREIRLAGELLRERGLHIHTAYMGGGTPTTLTAEQLDRVLSAVEDFLPMEQCAESTVEAGRPDTITADKLAVLRDGRTVEELTASRFQSGEGGPYARALWRAMPENEFQ